MSLRKRSSKRKKRSSKKKKRSSKRKKRSLKKKKRFSKKKKRSSKRKKRSSKRKKRSSKKKKRSSKKKKRSSKKNGKMDRLYRNPIPRDRETLIKFILHTARLWAKLTGRDQDMPLSRLKEESMKELRTIAQWYVSKEAKDIYESY